MWKEQKRTCFLWYIIPFKGWGRWCLWCTWFQPSTLIDVARDLPPDGRSTSPQKKTSALLMLWSTLEQTFESARIRAQEWPNASYLPASPTTFHSTFTNRKPKKSITHTYTKRNIKNISRCYNCQESLRSPLPSPQAEVTGEVAETPAWECRKGTTHSLT